MGVVDFTRGTSAMMFSIVVPSLGSPIDLQRLWVSLAQQDLRENVEVLLSVTGIANAESLLQLLPPLPSHFQVRLVENSIPGIAVARNSALQSAVGKYVVFLDDDCHLPRLRYLSDILKHFAQAPPMGLAGDYITDAATTSVASSFYNYMSNLWLKSFMTSSNDVSIVLGGCAIFPRQLLVESQARFEEKTERAAEEYGFGQQLTRHGVSIHYSKKWSVYHNPSCAWLSLFKKSWTHGRALTAYSSQREQYRWRALWNEFKSSPAQSLLFLPLLASYLLAGRIALFLKKGEDLVGSIRKPYLKRS